jgi:sorting nexin-4
LASSSTFDPFQTNYPDQDAYNANHKSPIQHTYQQSSKPVEADEFKAETMTILVDDPQKSSDGSFITYKVFTMVMSLYV